MISKPITDPRGHRQILWQVLLHVVNHATDHRAQLLRALHDLGVDTKSQDYIFLCVRKSIARGRLAGRPTGIINSVAAYANRSLAGRHARLGTELTRPSACR
ncbi:MAG: hypothetical protein IPG80_18510 [Anaerolineales bacterium]|nr:hypothetical protein [Anaerolineales bacterium]